MSDDVVKLEGIGRDPAVRAAADKAVAEFVKSRFGWVPFALMMVEENGGRVVCLSNLTGEQIVTLARAMSAPVAIWPGEKVFGNGPERTPGSEAGSKTVTLNETFRKQKT